MIQLIATVFCFFAAMFWYDSVVKAETYIELFFNLWFAIIFSGLFLMGVIVFAVS